MAEAQQRARLRFTDNGVEHEAVLERTPFTIGRLPDRDLVLQSPFVSRQHAEIVADGEALVLRDLASKAGCFVNGSRVNRHRLSDRDIIQVGSLEGPKIQLRLIGSTAVPLGTLLGQIGESSRPELGLGRLHWFLEAARRLNDLGPVHEIVGALIESTLQLTRAERGFVFLRDAAGDLAFAVGRDAEGRPLASDGTVSRSAIQGAVESRSEFIVTDTLAAEDFAPSESVLAGNLRVVICIPLRERSAASGPQRRPDHDPDRSGLLGVLYLDSRRQRDRFTSVDSNLLHVIAAEAAALVENATLVEAEEAARQARAELQVAAGIQRGLMAVHLPQLTFAEVDANSLPCKGIGGDFFDVLVIDGVLNVVVADVSGKGVSAALLGAMLQGLVHAQLLANQPLQRIAASANEFLCSRELGKYATLVLLRLGPDGMGEYINCGHVRPLQQQGEAILVLENGNLPVGLIAGASYRCESLQMHPKDRILVLTDGLTEAEHPDGECYGDTKLKASLLRGDGVPEILEELRSFTCGRPLEDDCTMLEVRFRR